MSEIAVRLGVDHDIEAARAVLRSAYVEYEDRFPPENWKPYLADILDIEGRSEASELLIAERGGVVLGCVSYFPPGSKASYPSDDHSETWPEDWAAIRLLGVAPEGRGQGIGKILTEACIERAREARAPALGLHTTEAMSLARAMYERMGFQRDARFDFRPGPKILVEAYRLDL